MRVTDGQTELRLPRQC